MSGVETKRNAFFVKWLQGFFRVKRGTAALNRLSGYLHFSRILLLSDFFLHVCGFAHSVACPHRWWSVQIIPVLIVDVTKAFPLYFEQFYSFYYIK